MQRAWAEVEKKQSRAINEAKSVRGSLEQVQARRQKAESELRAARDRFESALTLMREMLSESDPK